MKIGILAITTGGRQLAARLAEEIPGAILLDPSPGVARALAGAWQRMDALVCIMATGIVVRALAPLLGNKYTDPCVLVLDEKGKHVISLVSGHLGGGNQLAEEIAALTGGEPVITTASDTLGLPALDLWARGQGLLPASPEALTRASALLVNQGFVKIYAEVEIESLPPEFRVVSEPEAAEIIVSCRRNFPGRATVFHPRNLVIGVGCNRGTQASEFATALEELLLANNLARAGIRNLASIIDKNDETGLLDFARENGWTLVFYDKDELNRIEVETVSPAALRAVGAVGVAEPAALLSAKNNHLLIGKRKWRNVTMAVAEASFTLSEPGQARSRT